MDIMAKHAKPDQDGVRIAELDEMSYRHALWSHRPITDFWRVGRGYAKRLASYGLYTVGDIALCSEQDEDFLYQKFGINAELLIDHAWGWEPCEIRDIKKAKPRTRSLSSGQVLKEPYTYDKALVVALEMAEEAILAIKKRYGKNAILKGINFEDGATGRERNAQIGGHRA